MTDTITIEDYQLVDGVVGRVAASLSLLIDRDIEVDHVTTERANTRPAGHGVIHISFKLRIERAGAADHHGCVLVPLPEAIAMACYLMMLSDEEVEEHRTETELDESMKDAIMELGNFVGVAVDEAFGTHDLGFSVKPAGCQGVRADVRPAFPYEEGSELVVGRATACVHEFPAFEMIVMLPALFD